MLARRLLELPTISSITFSFMQEGMYQQVPTGRGMEWEVYNLTDTQTVFKKNIDNGGKHTILQVVPLG